HRLNASDVILEHDANEFYTYAIGYGDYGGNSSFDETPLPGEVPGGEFGVEINVAVDEDWRNAKLVREYTSPLAKIPGIGIRHAPPIKNGNIKLKDTMDEQLKTLVDESLKIFVSATIHDLRKQGYALA